MLVAGNSHHGNSCPRLGARTPRLDRSSGLVIRIRLSAPLITTIEPRSRGGSDGDGNRHGPVRTHCSIRGCGIRRSHATGRKGDFERLRTAPVYSHHYEGVLARRQNRLRDDGVRHQVVESDLMWQTSELRSPLSGRAALHSARSWAPGGGAQPVHNAVSRARHRQPVGHRRRGPDLARVLRGALRPASQWRRV